MSLRDSQMIMLPQFIKLPQKKYDLPRLQISIYNIHKHLYNKKRLQYRDIYNFIEITVLFHFISRLGEPNSNVK